MFFYFGLLWEDFRYISQFSRGTNRRYVCTPALKNKLKVFLFLSRSRKIVADFHKHQIQYIACPTAIFNPHTLHYHKVLKYQVDIYIYQVLNIYIYVCITLH